jgi:antitoxin (DNA-binding transcriptional repressor) of toxin-antitoxin stability system
MITISLEEAQAKLSELIHNLKPGEELLITENSQRVAKLTGEIYPQNLPRQKGSAKGKLIVHSEDDEHLEAFQEYLP